MTAVMPFNAGELLDLGRAVACRLDHEAARWTVSVEGEGAATMATFSDPEAPHRAFTMRADWTDPTRLAFRCRWPVDHNRHAIRPSDAGALPYGASEPGITVGRMRGADAIAKELARRFLPEALAVLDRVQAYAVASAKQRAETLRLVAAYHDALSRAGFDVDRREGDGGTRWTLYAERSAEPPENRDPMRLEVVCHAWQDRPHHIVITTPDWERAYRLIEALR